MSKIPWTELTWNPIIGCSKVSAGCANCYAEKMARRLAAMGMEGYCYATTEDGKWSGKCTPRWSALEKPLRWKKPRMIFVCSMGDLFHESVPFEWIDEVFKVMVKCKHHTFQVLTKRPERMKEYFTHLKYFLQIVGTSKLPAANVWLGVTAENQAMADERIPILLEIPAAKRFVSVEPMLEDMYIGRYLLTDREKASHDTQIIEPAGGFNDKKLDWVIVGAESGANRRECKPEWAERIVGDCAYGNVPCFVKQLHSIHNGKTTLIKMPVGFPQEFPDQKERI